MAYNVHARTASFAKGKSRTLSIPLGRRSLRTLLIALLSVFFLVALWRHHSSTASTPKAHKQSHIVDDVLDTKPRVRKPKIERDVWSDVPAQHDMHIVNPLYSVRVLRSILQHSNTTWQDTKGECQGYFIQSLLWLNIVDGMRPKDAKANIEAVCMFRHASQIVESPSIVHVHGTQPGDRLVGHSFPFYVECEVPEELASDPKGIRDITIDLVFLGGQVEVETIGSEHQNVSVIAQKRDLPVKITPPMPQHSEFAVCLSPMWFEEEKLPLWRLLEWRQHMANLGIERVNWYARDPKKFEDFVEGYRELRGSKDLFIHAPNLIAYPESPETGTYEQYADQDAVYMSCILNNIQSSDYVLVLDTDEFLMPDFRLENPLEQVKTFFRDSPKWMGQYAFDRVEMVRPFAQGEPPMDDLQQASFTCASNGGAIRDVAKWGPEVKTIYRSNTVHAANQHRSRQMYPMPFELSQAAGKRKNEKYQWHQQHSNEESVWPKLFHYRWYGWAAGDVCQKESPVARMPKYDRYVSELRQTVSQMVDKLAHVQLDQR